MATPQGVLAGSPGTQSESAPAAAATPAVQDAPKRERKGLGLLITGASVAGLGAVSRIAMEGFWFGTVGLRAQDPFQRWSVNGIITMTNLGNVFVAPGLTMVGVGAFRRGHYLGDAILSPKQRATRRKLGWALLGSGAGLFVLTRAIAMPVVNACESNGCVYGYLESTYWLSLAALTPGLVMTSWSAGVEKRRSKASLSLLPARDGARLQLRVRW
jgi:hypothetical protein